MEEDEGFDYCIGCESGAEGGHDYPDQNGNLGPRGYHPECILNFEEDDPYDEYEYYDPIDNVAATLIQKYARRRNARKTVKNLFKKRRDKRHLKKLQLAKGEEGVRIWADRIAKTMAKLLDVPHEEPRLSLKKADGRTRKSKKKQRNKKTKKQKNEESKKRRIKETKK